MKNRLKITQPVLAIIVSVLLVVCPAYLQYNSLIEIDFLSSNPGFEELDPGNLVADKQSKTKIFASVFSPLIFLFDFAPMGQLPLLSFQIFFLDHPTTVLRC
jgi:hypothetical protein